jgi:signal transduction histidine kinase
VVGTIVPESDSTGSDLRPLMVQICADPKRFERSVNENVRRNGKRAWIDWTNRVVIDEQGQITEILSIGSDITERKQAEAQVQLLNEQLRVHAENLERRVLARTAQLAEKNQELKEFAYTVSHDLKAPLRGIAGYANELNRKHRAGLGDRAQFCVEQILTATTHLDQLIEDLLRYSRLDAEMPSSTAVDLRGLVDMILHDHDLTIKERQIEVTVDIPFAILRTWERGLAQVLGNLIDNAIKYSRNAQPPRLRISAAEVAGAWQVSVGDNGIGFDMKYHDRIFKLFNRLVRMEEFEGTGAGLAIAKKVVEKQGGRLWAESAPGQGATFFVELPKPVEGT